MDFKVKILLIVFGIIMTLVVSVGGWKIFSLNNEVSFLKESIEIKDAKIVELNLINLSNEKNISELRRSIDIENFRLLEVYTEKQALINEVNEWKNKPAEIKYVDKVVKEIIKEPKYIKGVCDDGLELNRMIGGLKYEDLK